MKIKRLPNKEALPQPAKLDGIKYILEKCGYCRIEPEHPGWAKAKKWRINGKEFIVYEYGCKRTDEIEKGVSQIISKVLKLKKPKFKRAGEIKKALDNAENA